MSDEQNKQPIGTPRFEQTLDAAQQQDDPFQDPFASPPQQKDEYRALHEKLEAMTRGGERLTEDEATRLAALADERADPNAEINRTTGGAHSQTLNKLSPARQEALWDAGALAGYGYQVKYNNLELQRINEREQKAFIERSDADLDFEQLNREQNGDDLYTAQAKQELREREAEEAEEEALADRDYQIENLDAFPEQRQHKPVLPPHIQKKYQMVNGRFYFDRQPDVVAFEDAGDKLKTKLDSQSVAKDMVDLADARGWQDLRVKGSESFRRSVWIESQARGIEVTGYHPTEADYAALQKRQKELGNDDPSKSPQHDQAEDVRNLPPKDLTKKHPNLASTAAAIAIAEKVSERFHREEDRQQFLSNIRDDLAKRVERNADQPAVKIREPIKEQDQDQTQER